MDGFFVMTEIEETDPKYEDITFWTWLFFPYRKSVIYNFLFMSSLTWIFIPGVSLILGPIWGLMAWGDELL